MNAYTRAERVVTYRRARFRAALIGIDHAREAVKKLSSTSLGALAIQGLIGAVSCCVQACMAEYFTDAELEAEGGVDGLIGAGGRPC